MTDPALIARYRTDMWAAVNALTQPSRHAVLRDDGTTTWANVASLWQQSLDALAGGLETSVGGGNAFERAPVDLTLIATRTLIGTATRRALISRRQRPKPLVPGQIRQLAAYAVTYEPGRLAAHTQRFQHWQRMLTSHLATERTVTAVHIRNACCPDCGARAVLNLGPDGTDVVVPALIVDFHDGYVRAARCAACGATWFRGRPLESLAILLGCPVVA